MCKFQHGNPRNMKKQGNGTSPKIHNFLVTDSKDIEVDEMPDKEFKKYY
jgi:hypothetical protein